MFLHHGENSSSKDSESHPPIIQKLYIKPKSIQQPMSKKIPKLAGKRASNKLTKIATKRRKYVRTKKKTFEVSAGFFDSDKAEQSQNRNGTVHLLPVVDLLEKHNFKYEVMPESHKHDNFFLQDKYMNTVFQKYPEYLCIDFLCEIPQLEVNVCLFISVDGNGYCEIIAVGFIKTFDSGLLWLCELFKKYNSNWHKIKLITCDKKGRNLELIKIAFPDKMVLISVFQCIKTLKKDLLNLDQKVLDSDIDQAIHLFERMVSSLDESSYTENFKQLKLMQPLILTYFKKVWHQKKETWAWGQYLNSKIFVKTFNFYLLNIRKKIRPMINVQTSMENVINKLCNLLDIMRKERFQNFASVFFVPTEHSNQHMYQKYSKFITRYATDLVYEQFTDSPNVKNVCKLSYGKYICSSKDIVTTNGCSCNFFQLLSLPCCHIFALRKQLSLPLFFEESCASRWTASDYQTTYLDLYNILENQTKKCDIDNSVVNKRFEKCFKLCSELWPLLMECPENVYQDRMQIYQNLLEAWSNGIKVNIKKSEIENSALNCKTMDSGESTSDYWKEMYGISLKDILDSDNDFATVSSCSDISNAQI